MVEQALARDGQPFIANASDLSPRGSETSGQIWIVTGPNMAGKSTFLRQNALIALMAQIGSFVPAKRARIGIVDRLFSRVGAADDLARGRSTFMVEMVETAAILNQAGERALVILDEIGRGTATFDGLSIAWAAIEHLHEENRCRALFATHYHELTALAAKLPRLFNATVRVKEWQGDVVFLHEVMPGAADRSYGIQVAKLAGLPAGVIARAKTILAKLEAQDRSSTTRALAEDLPLFATTSRAVEEKIETPADRLLKAFEALHPDDMSPREALDALYALKKTLGRIVARMSEAISGSSKSAPDIAALIRATAATRFSELDPPPDQPKRQIARDRHGERGTKARGYADPLDQKMRGEAAERKSRKTQQRVGQDGRRGRSADPRMQNEDQAQEHDRKHGEDAGDFRADHLARGDDDRDEHRHHRRPHQQVGRATRQQRNTHVAKSISDRNADRKTDDIECDGRHRRPRNGVDHRNQHKPDRHRRQHARRHDLGAAPASRRSARKSRRRRSRQGSPARPERQSSHRAEAQ